MGPDYESFNECVSRTAVFAAISGIFHIALGRYDTSCASRDNTNPLPPIANRRDHEDLMTKEAPHEPRRNRTKRVFGPGGQIDQSGARGPGHLRSARARPHP